MSPFLLWCSCLALVQAAEPVRPVDDSQVLIQLHRRDTSAPEREMRPLRRSVRDHPDDVATALQLAQKLVAQARAESDPRYLGQAESVLAPWWSKPDAPIEVLLLRANIEQSRHQFKTALATLDQILARDSRAGGAWLIRATLLTLQGDYLGARRSCLPLVRLTDPVTATTAAAAVGGLTGEAERSLNLLEAALIRAPGLASATLVWSHNVAADLAERLGRPTDAERHLQAALKLSPMDPFTLGQWADFLLLQGRAIEVVVGLAPHADQDALLLRYAEAKKAVARGKLEPVQPEMTRLQSGFAAARRRGISHAREEARFNLRLLNAPRRALELAWENWEQQREPTDLRLLLECGQAAGDVKAVASAQAWLRTNRLEDAVFLRLNSAL